MIVRIRLGRKLDDYIRKDLERPHEFAYERVGFLSSRFTMLDHDTLLVFLTRYDPVDDEDYIDDKTVGARINGNAIRKAMQRVLDTKDGMFHVHMHPGNHLPGLSITDRNEIPPIIQSFRNVEPNVIHGILLMSESRYRAYVFLPSESKWIETIYISVVGFPTSLNL